MKKERKDKRNLNIENRTVGLRNKLGILAIVFLLIFAGVTGVVNANIKLKDPSGSDFGYWGDGSIITNSNGKSWTATGANLQTAIWDLNSTNGGAVYMPKDVTTFSTTLKMTNNTSLKGAGMGKTVLYVPNNFDASAIDVLNVENVTLSDFTINGNKAGQGAGLDSIHTIDISHSSKIVVHDVEVLNGWTAGIRTEFTNDVAIFNCWINNSGDDAIAINEMTSYANVYCNFINNTGAGAKHYGEPNGIEVQDGSSYVIVESNIIRNSDATGISMGSHAGKPPCKHVKIINNNIYNETGGRGITIIGQDATDLLSNVTIIGNTCVGSGGFKGIVLNYCEFITVNDNSISGGSYGIMAYYTNKYVTINDNTIRNVVDAWPFVGVYVHTDAHNNSVTFNTIYDCKKGIMIYGNDTDVTNNRIFDSRSGASRSLAEGIMIYGSANSSFVSSNIIFNIVTTTLSDAGTDSYISGNNIDGVISELILPISIPSYPVAGSVYVNATTGLIGRYTGSAWVWA